MEQYTDTTVVLKKGEVSWTPGSTKREFYGPGVIVYREDNQNGCIGIDWERTTAKVRYK
jgi:hypothetical protein